MNSVNQKKEECLSALAHNLRNPLASIMSSVELMQALGQNAEQIPHLLEVIDQKVTIISSVLDSFIDKSSGEGMLLPGDLSSLAKPVKSLRVLVVDDNTTAADYLSQLLRLRGHDVETAYTGMEGVEKVLAFSPQVAILDIGLPDIDGYKVKEMLDKEHVVCTFIALTGYGLSKDKERAMVAGFDFHLTKPASIKTIYAILRHTLASIDKKTKVSTA